MTDKSLRERVSIRLAEALTYPGPIDLADVVMEEVHDDLDKHATRAAELESQNAALHARLEDEIGAKQIAAEAADRFRDAVCEVMGFTDNPGDDATITALRGHFGKTGPESRRWRDFMTWANAQRDQINAERAKEA